MKAIRIAYAFVALCGGLALTYTPQSADAAEAGPKCSDCTVYPDGHAHCETCEWT